MPAVVTDQFRIFNANNFVDSLFDSSNSYYVFLGLSNPIQTSPGFGRTTRVPIGQLTQLIIYSIFLSIGIRHYLVKKYHHRMSDEL